MDFHYDYRRALVIAASNVSPDTRDWIESINERARYTIHVWDRVELENRISKHSDLLKEYFKTAEILQTVDFPTRVIQSLTEYNSEPIQFKTGGGEVIIAGQVTGSATVSGASMNLSIRIDGKLAEERQLEVADNPTPNNLYYRLDQLSYGSHGIGFALRNNNSSTQEVVSGKIRIIEIPPGL
jgi:hypothetical protein